MKKILFATAASAAFFAATPALAQGAPVAPAGPRVEALIGYDRVKLGGEHDGGVLFGIGAGYDFAVGNGVSLGADIEATESTQKIGDEDIAEVKAGRDLYAGGRIGYAVGRNVLLYGKAGYTNARLSLDYDDGTAATALDFSNGENLDGVRVGGGLEFALGPNSYAKTEYRYSNYEQGFDRHQVVAGFGFRF